MTASTSAMQVLRFTSSEACCFDFVKVIGLSSLCLLLVCSPPSSVVAQQATEPEVGSLQFSFNAAAWREVLTWIAEEGGYALHTNEYPSGTFTYSDPNRYTPTEALDRLNLFLIPEGFTAVRSGKLLTLINLSNSKSLLQLDSMARMIDLQELAAKEEHDVVKCLFPLGKLESASVAGELSGLNLMTEPIVLPESNQLLITDTARKLRAVEKVIQALSSVRDDSSVVRSFTLNHVELKRFLRFAGDHLGITPDQTTASEINITSDESGKQIYVTGTEAKVELLENLITEIDRPEQVLLKPMQQSERNVNRELRSHRVEDVDLQTVYDVLQTILLDESIRISMESETQSIVALANPETHNRIQETIAELSSKGADDRTFDVVQLESLDPYFAITLIEQMYDGLADPATEGMKIDADPDSRRLFLRGTQEQIEEITSVVSKLDEPGRYTRRVLPFYGSNAGRLLEATASSWDGRVSIMTSDNAVQSSISETVVGQPESSPLPPVVSPPSSVAQLSAVTGEDKNSTVQTAGFLQGQGVDPDTIRARVTDQGIVLESSDVVSLASFERELRNLAAKGSSAHRIRTSVFYLRYTTADDAVKTLADLLEGTSSLMDESTGPSLVNGEVPRQPGASVFSEASTSSGDAGVRVSAGTLTAISDSRLNRLICLGTPEDLDLVKQYLEVIDKEQSMTEIETRGISKVVDLQFTKAPEVAKMVRDAYVGRIAIDNAERKQQAQAIAAKHGVAPNLMTSSSSESEITLAVHEQTNSLVVTAPKKLLDEVVTLIEQIDQRGEKVIEVLHLPNSRFIHDRLLEMFDKLQGKSK